MLSRKQILWKTEAAIPFDTPSLRIYYKTDTTSAPFRNSLAIKMSAPLWFTPWDILIVHFLEIIMIEYHYVYVLRSLKDKMFYVGFTHDIIKRVSEHNKGIVPSTRTRIPFELVYWEGCLNQQDATRREKYLKTAWGKRYIKNRLNYYLTGWTPMF